MKHIKTFEQYNFNDEQLNEELFGGGIKKSIEKIENIDNMSDEELKNLFMEVFEKTKSLTNIAVNHWKLVKKQFDEGKISREKMIELLNKIKEDYTKNKKNGYLVFSQGQVLYKVSTAMKTSMGDGPSYG